MKEKLIKLLESRPVQLICQTVLGGLFIYAGFMKIKSPHGFAMIIYNYKLIPDIFVTVMAALMPWVEIIAGIFLVAGIFKRTSATLLTALLAVFMIAISVNLIRGLEFDCGCFTTVTSEEGSDPVGLLIRDILLMIPGLVVIFFSKNKKKQAQPQPAAS